MDVWRELVAALPERRPAPAAQLQGSPQGRGPAAAAAAAAAAVLPGGDPLHSTIVQVYAHRLDALLEGGKACRWAGGGQ